MKFNRAFTLLAFVSGSVLSSANAQVYIDSNFESGTTTGWSSRYNATAVDNISVVADPLRAGNQVLKWDSTTLASTRLLTSGTANLSTGQYKLTLQFLVGESGGSGSSYSLSRNIAMLNNSTYAVSSYNPLAYNPAQPEAFDTTIRGYNGNGAGGGTPGALQYLAENNWYELTQIIDMDTKTWSWSIYDVTAGAAVYQSPTGLGFLSSPTSIRELHFFSGSDNGLLYVDNVLLQAVPEPSAAMLLGLGLVAFIVFRKRHGSPTP